MDRIRIAVAALLVSMLVGCGQSEVNEQSSTTVADSAIPTNLAGDPAVRAAYGFLQAVLDGDSQQASNWLTPMAIQQIVQSGKQFAPAGVENAELRVEQAFHASDSQAVVQCVLIEATAGGEEKNEKVHCLLRQVEGRWGVAAIAYEIAPGGRQMTLNFEKSATPARQQTQPPTQMAAGQPAQPPIQPAGPPVEEADRYNTDPPAYMAQPPGDAPVYR